MFDVKFADLEALNPISYFVIFSSLVGALHVYVAPFEFKELSTFSILLGGEDKTSNSTSYGVAS
jgi:hypothetical protein